MDAPSSSGPRRRPARGTPRWGSRRTRDRRRVHASRLRAPGRCRRAAVGCHRGRRRTAEDLPYEADEVAAMMRRAIDAVWERSMSSLLVTGIGELVTWDDERPVRTTPPSSSRTARVAWIGPPPRRPPPTTCATSAVRAVVPGFVDSHSHLVFAGDRAGGVRGADDRAALRRRRHPHHRRRHPGRQRRAARRRTSRRLVAEMRAPGDDDRRDQERLRADRARRGAVAGDRARSSPTRPPSSAPTSSRTAPSRRRTSTLVTGADARGLRPARPVDRRVLRGRRVRCRRGTHRPRGRHATPACGRGSTPTSWATAPASSWRSSSVRRRPTTART